MDEDAWGQGSGHSQALPEVSPAPYEVTLTEAEWKEGVLCEAAYVRKMQDIERMEANLEELRRAREDALPQQAGSPPPPPYQVLTPGRDIQSMGLGEEAVDRCSPWVLDQVPVTAASPGTSQPMDDGLSRAGSAASLEAACLSSMGGDVEGMSMDGQDALEGGSPMQVAWPHQEDMAVPFNEE